MFKFFKIFFLFAKNSLMSDLEFRFAFLVWVFVDIFWFLLTIVSVQLVYGQVSLIAGWSKNEALLLTTVHGLFLSFAWIFVMPNLTVFHETIRQGTLDFAILKPINLRFAISTKRVEFDMLLRTTIIFVVLFKILQTMNLSVGGLDLSIFLALFFLGQVIFYNFCFIIATTNVWFVNLSNLENLLDAVQDVGRMPSEIFKGFSKYFFVYLIPTGFFAVFPTMTLLKRGGVELLIFAIIGAIISTIISQLFWNFALKHYSSASS